LIGKDFLKLMFGIGVSLVLVILIQHFAN